jgi:bacterial polymer biosynthesis proteins, WecB/TagA/CpsF family
VSFLRVPVTLLSSNDALALVAERPADAEFGYVVTPNVDHVVRVHRQSARFSWLYRKAWLSICDSRILSVMAGAVGIELPVTTGSDLTRSLFEQVLQPGDRVTVIGCREDTIEILRGRYPGLHIAHYNPPMGFISKEDEVAKVIEFVAVNPGRFVFLSVGSPRQEVLAYRLRQRGGLTGLGLCVGNAINFLAFPETRAPQWISRYGLEWLYRLSTDPKRLWRRYLVDDPLILAIFAKAMATNSAIEPSPVMGADALPVGVDQASAPVDALPRA